MDQIISSHIQNGEIDEGELDEGVILLCKRHSATIVERALKEYVEEKMARKDRKEKLGDREDDDALNFRNPSAFFTHIIGRVAEEGLGQKSTHDSRKDLGSYGRGRGGGGRRQGGRGEGDGRGQQGRGDGPGRGSVHRKQQQGGGVGKESTKSVNDNRGVDMSISDRNGSERGGGQKISQIFPSMRRGRGRGRGYM